MADDVPIPRMFVPTVCLKAIFQQHAAQDGTFALERVRGFSKSQTM